LVRAAVALLSCAAVLAQTPPPPSAPPEAKPAERSGDKPADKPAEQKVEVTGGRESDADQRRRSTAAKIVIGREEIERFGDSTLGEVLKRLPGITTPGPPGRGGPPRMRGLGAGYTQILIDGQRAPAGFSLDQLTPEQLERIEIFRAPTAETGARAIGGTINIVTREGFRARRNEVRAGFAVEANRFTPGLFWTRNDSDGNFVYNLTGAVFGPHGRPRNRFTSTEEDLASSTLRRLETQQQDTEFSRVGTNVNARLQWRGEAGDMLMLMPGLFATRGDSRTVFRITEFQGSPAPTYDNGTNDNRNRSATLRLNGQWRKRLAGDFRLELNGGATLTRGNSDSLRQEFDQAAVRTRTETVSSDSRERSLNLNGKLSRLLGGAGSEHSFVGGWEIEGYRREETRITLNNGVHQFGDEDDNLAASSTRVALYAQDEWALSANWSAHFGLRTETIVTRGDAFDGAGNPRNRSQVTTPLLHLLYKPDPKQRDQIRISLTRSYKSPTLANLIARPSVSSRFPLPGANTPTFPDRAGNPDLRPELATGIDVAAERYLAEGGVLSANVFARRLTDYIRNITRLEAVSYAPMPRYVSRPANIGGAFTAGIELEAKFRLDQWIADAPRTEVRSNLSLFRSRVDEVPGPDNRLDQQPKGTLNLGADHRFRGTPLTVGASLNLTPAYRTQLSEDQALTTPRRRQFDAFVLWVFDPTVQLRLNLTNLLPEDYTTSNTVDLAALRERQINMSKSYLSTRLALELKL
jgi:iron complex outermembrane receptor protein